MIDTTDMSTEDVLKIALDYAKEHSIPRVVIATTKGDTGIAAAKLFPDSIELIAVTHSAGFSTPGEDELPKEMREEMELAGMNVLTASMPFHSWNDFYRKGSGAIMPTTIIADTLRIFGQGPKVCVEIVAMATDAGLIPHGEPVLSIAGTGRGANTVMLIRAENTRRLFKMLVLDLVAKPKSKR